MSEIITKQKLMIERLKHVVDEPVFAVDGISCIERYDRDEGYDRRMRYTQHHNPMHIPFETDK